MTLLFAAARLSISLNVMVRHKHDGSAIYYLENDIVYDTVPKDYLCTFLERTMSFGAGRG
jgi:hypothetical protein